MQKRFEHDALPITPPSFRNHAPSQNHICIVAGDSSGIGQRISTAPNKKENHEMSHGVHICTARMQCCVLQLRQLPEAERARRQCLTLSLWHHVLRQRKKPSPGFVYDTYLLSYPVGARSVDLLIHGVAGLAKENKKEIMRERLWLGSCALCQFLSYYFWFFLLSTWKLCRTSDQR